MKLGWNAVQPRARMPRAIVRAIRVIDFVRYDEGRIAEHWGIVDVAGLMAQLSEGA